MTTWRVQDVMTTEVITAPDDASVTDIVALLTDRKITAVPIVDRFDAVLGVVSWTDLRRRIDVREPATVDGGVVTLTGHTARRTTAVAAARLTGAVPGVAGVVDRLTFDVDDTVVAVPARRAAERDPLRGWWPAAGPAARPERAAAGAV